MGSSPCPPRPGTGDTLTGALEKIRERYRTSFTTLPGFTTSPGTPWAHVNSADDVPLLVAAVEAVLKLADDAGLMSIDAAGAACAWDLDPAEVREAITAALTPSAHPAATGGEEP
jgi:hypothetical protein